MERRDKCAGPTKPRIALVTNTCAHYRLPLYQRLARLFNTDFYFTAMEGGRHWSPDHSVDSRDLRAFEPSSSLALAVALLRGRYNCFVVGMVGRVSLLAALLVARIARRPVVLWVGIWEHPRTLFHRLTRPLVRRLYRRADALLVYGSHVTAYVEAESGRCHRVFEAPQAVDNERFRSVQRASRRVADGELVALFVGRLEAEKGLEILLDALALTNHDVSLVIAGSGSLEAALRSQAEAPPLVGRVVFLGYVVQDELPHLYSGVDLLVLPSVATKRVRETWGLVVNEAMNAGLPVVATTAVGAAAGGLVVDRKTGLVVQEGDPSALASALDALAEDRYLRDLFGRNARDRVAAWSHDAAAAGFVAAVEAALSSAS